MKYRDHKGRFRKETDEEYGKRCGELALFFRIKWRVTWQSVAKNIASSNPYLDLLKS